MAYRYGQSANGVIVDKNTGYMSIFYRQLLSLSAYKLYYAQVRISNARYNESRVIVDV